MSPIVLFAVNKDSKRWRFRIDDIAHFQYFVNESPYENHTFLINTLTTICNTLKKQSICDYIRSLMRYAEDLKNSEHIYYIEILISNVELSKK